MFRTTNHEPRNTDLFFIERQKALTAAAHQLNHLMAVQRDIEHRLRPFAVELALPAERVWIDALAQLSQLYKQDGQ